MGDSRSQLSNDPFNLSFNLKVKGSVGNWDILNSGELCKEIGIQCMIVSLRLFGGYKHNYRISGLKIYSEFALSYLISIEYQ
jgi:hypothetical protein